MSGTARMEPPPPTSPSVKPTTPPERTPITNWNVVIGQPPGCHSRRRIAYRARLQQGPRQARRDRKSTRLTPVTNAHLVCRLLLEKKKQTTQNLTSKPLYSTH